MPKVGIKGQSVDPRIDLTKPIYEQALRLSAERAVDDSTLAILGHVKPRLTDDDDETLWKLIVSTVLSEIDALNKAEGLSENQFLKVGSCSHWLRPHQTRWTAAGGFAWPSGYGSSGPSRDGLPELDWSLLFEKTFDGWKPALKYKGKARLDIRVSVPARSVRHAQAAIHTHWSPMNRKIFYGFRKCEDGWKLVARSDFWIEGAKENGD